MLSGARTRPRLQQASSAPLHAQFTGQPPPPRLYTRHPAQLGPVHSSPEAPQDSSRQDTRGLTSSPCEPHCIWRESSSSSAGEQPVGLGGPDHRRHTCRRVSLSTCGLAGPHPPRSRALPDVGVGIHQRRWEGRIQRPSQARPEPCFQKPFLGHSAPFIFSSSRGAPNWC